LHQTKEEAHDHGLLALPANFSSGERNEHLFEVLARAGSKTTETGKAFARP